MRGDFWERLIAGRWIAGSSVESAERRIVELNSLGVTAILNYLGEYLTGARDIRKAKAEYIVVIDRISRMRLKADISIKATQLGLLLGQRAFLSNYGQIVRHAKEKGVFVWMDMEESRFVDDTVAAYKKMMRYGNTGICIQSYLKRSLGDLRGLGRNSTVRLVKGAYYAQGADGFSGRAGTTHNYAALMDYIFRKFSRFTIATHDAAMIDRAQLLNKRYRRDVTYAMLNGIRDRYAYSLAKKGCKVSMYVPFGRDWAGYASRRLGEAGGAKLLLRSLLGNN